jgi:hypothetical protein
VEELFARRNEARKKLLIRMDFTRKFAEDTLGFNFMAATYGELYIRRREISHLLKIEKAKLSKKFSLFEQPKTGAITRSFRLF